MQVAHKTSLGIKGNVVLPAKIRKYLNIGPGDQIGFVLDGEHVKIIPVNLVIKKFQALIKSRNKNNISLVDSLRATRDEEGKNG